MEKFFIIYERNTINIGTYPIPAVLMKPMLNLKSKIVNCNGRLIPMKIHLMCGYEIIEIQFFIKRLLCDYGQPQSIIVTDKYALSLKTIKDLQNEYILAKEVNH